MTNRKSIAAIAALLILSLVGCSTSTVITDLQVALDAVSVALPVIGGLTGVPADVVTAATTYLAAANQALGQASTILDGTGTDATKAAQIAAAFAAIAVPVVPAQYAALAGLVQTVATDVAHFLGTLPGAAPSAQARAMAAHAGTTTKLSLDDRVKLAHAHAVSADNAAKLAKLPHR